VERRGFRFSSTTRQIDFPEEAHSDTRRRVGNASLRQAVCAKEATREEVLDRCRTAISSIRATLLSARSAERCDRVRFASVGTSLRSSRWWHDIQGHKVSNWSPPPSRTVDDRVCARIHRFGSAPLRVARLTPHTRHVSCPARSTPAFPLGTLRQGGMAPCLPIDHDVVWPFRAICRWGKGRCGGRASGRLGD
jgi:hypothetical protein